ncbi:lipoxygenase [Xylariales sp. PMI_506]|nr:lipoxygenase [Xylariales sp. PMI_506]
MLSAGILGAALCLFQPTSVAASPIAAVNVKRDNTTATVGIQLIDALLEGFAAGIPNITQNGLVLLEELLGSLPNQSYSIPQNCEDASTRATNLETVRSHFLYGAAVAGGPFYPSGDLGIAKDVLDISNIQTDLVAQIELAEVDDARASQNTSKYNNLQTLDDYAKLYDGEWTNSLPNGPDPGVLTNYTQDLYFSMQRLSTSPYQIRRLDPTADCLPFQVSDCTISRITGMKLSSLLEQGRLFYADYRDQKDLVSTGKYAAAVDAYFYIDATSGDFLPLAIRTNQGANLIYTPLDSANDWLLAKMMYNVNDFWFAQWNHLAATHEVVQIVWMAAIRTLSQEHPVFAILSRLMYEVFAVQNVAASTLFSPGAAVDVVFAFTGQSAQNYTSYLYSEAGSGRFQANYFINDLQARGLINSTCGPELKSFPFYEDGSVIYNAIHSFMTSFVKSYYSSDSVLLTDTEIQAWLAECHGDAQVIDFPSAISSIDTLVDILTHMAHLVSTAHHAVNTNELLAISSTLPFNPPALYSPLPTEKSADTNPVDFLPALDSVMEQFIVGSLFARPLLVGTNRTIIHMFDDSTMLTLMNSEVQSANAEFMEAMEEFSAQVSARTFDADGLCQGMPYVWKALDPNVAPFAITI